MHNIQNIQNEKNKNMAYVINNTNNLFSFLQ